MPKLSKWKAKALGNYLRITSNEHFEFLLKFIISSVALAYGKNDLLIKKWSEANSKIFQFCNLGIVWMIIPIDVIYISWFFFYPINILSNMYEMIIHELLNYFQVYVPRKILHAE